ncbi:MAG: hypothetical protein ACR2N5_07195, partial [Solirubrobacterales bacterium]
PPGHAGLNILLTYAKLGPETAPVERWFSQYQWERGLQSLKFRALTSISVRGGRLGRRRLASPQHAPLDDPSAIVEWLAEAAAAGRPGILETYSSSAVRVCLAAQEAGADISGSVMQVSGDPFTAAKAAVLADAGVRGANEYGMGELTRVGLPCANPVEPDDCHLVTDKVAVIQHDIQVGEGGVSVPALGSTSLLPTAPRIALNMQVGDYGTLERRECGCAMDTIGLDLHAHSISSYDKSTTEGMNLLGPVLSGLVDEFLPGRFGGTPTDYQLVGREDDALGRLELVVSPRVAPGNDDQIVAAALDYVEAEGSRLTAELWRDGRALRVLRREPEVTPSGKILPFHLVR